MARHVLVPVDGSKASWAALDHALSEYGGERITLLHVVDPLEGAYPDEDGNVYTPEAQDRAAEHGEELCEEGRSRAEEYGVLETTEVDSAVEVGKPAQTIVAYADEHDVDHVVMGSHGRSGIERLLLGSVAEDVARRSPVPVTIVR